MLALLAFLSGALLPDLNYDTDAYRLPRVCHWLWAGKWHWIHTFDPRMNIAACGFEWLCAPLILFTHTDRFLFLINWISYLLLPGLIFSVFTRLQVRPRVAWWWMWFLAAGWCFALQAGSTDNDSLAAVYILAAVDLALRARERKFCGGLVAVAAGRRAGDRRETNQSAACAAVADCRLARPATLPDTSGRKFVGRGSWSARFRRAHQHFELSSIMEPGCRLNLPGLPSMGKFHLNPFWGIIGNAFCIPLQNLMPPFHELLPPYFRFSVSLWNEQMRTFLQTPFGAHFSSFENFGYLSAEYYRSLCSGNAGIGLGVCILTFATFLELRRQRKNIPAGIIIPRDPLRSWLRAVPWLLLLLFMAEVGTFSSARHLAPYYIFLFPIFLVKPGQARVVRQARWQRLGLEIMVLTVLVVAGAGNRPLLPLPALWQALHAKFPDNELVTDQHLRYAESDYVAAAARKNFLNKSLPPDETVVGYYATSFNLDEPALWLPYGRRRVECIAPGDPPERLRLPGVHYAVVHLLPAAGGITNWLEKYNGTLAGQYTFPRTSGKKELPVDLYLVRLN